MLPITLDALTLLIQQQERQVACTKFSSSSTQRFSKGHMIHGGYGKLAE